MRVFDQYVRVVITVIGAAVVVQALLKPEGAVAVGRLFVDLPVQLASVLTGRRV